MRPYLPSIVMRILYLALLIRPYRIGGLDGVSMNLVIFAVTLPVAWLGRKDIRWSATDAALLAVSAGASAFSLIATPLQSSIIGPDKAFHFLGGVAAGLLALLALRPFVPNRWAYAALIIVSTLAIGATWEVFEWVFLLAHATPTEYYGKLLFSDTMLDMVADTLGGACVAFVSLLRDLKR